MHKPIKSKKYLYRQETINKIYLKQTNDLCIGRKKGNEFMFCMSELEQIQITFKYLRNGNDVSYYTGMYVYHGKRFCLIEINYVRSQNIFSSASDNRQVKSNY